MMQFLRKAREGAIRGTALLRLDFNTEDEWRMEATLPTVRFLEKRAEKVVIMSHRGRPSAVAPGKSRGRDIKLSLRRDARFLQKFLKRKIIFIPHFRLSEIRRKVAAAPRHSIFLLENLRFAKGEEKNDPRFGKALALLGDYYVNDAFAVSHRANASIEAITRFLSSYAGLELEKEITFLSHVLAHPRRPLVVVLGGGKAHDKLGVMKYFRKKADAFLLGGAAANTLLKLRGLDIKKSTSDKDPKDLKKLQAVLRYKNLVLPVDYKTKNERIIDIGPNTIKDYKERITHAKTIIWSGPLGYIELKPFDQGTLALARAVAENKKAFSVTGGGETVMFLKKHHLDKKFSFISTGGGAMLDFLAGEKLPGIEALRRHGG